MTAFLQGENVPLPVLPPPLPQGVVGNRRQYNVGSLLGPPSRKEDQRDEEFRADLMAHNNLLVLRGYNRRIFASRNVDFVGRSKEEEKNCGYIIDLLREILNNTTIAKEKEAIQLLMNAVSLRRQVLGVFLHEVELSLIHI